LEIICDLIYKIKQRDKWQTKQLFGNKQFLVPPLVFLDNSITFKPGLELIVNIPVGPRDTTDIYIDGYILRVVDIEGTHNFERSNCAPLLAFDKCSRSLDSNKPIPRETMEARNKLHSEALL
jgi:hypothetical protein